MIKKGKGGANTKTGLVFEKQTDLRTFLNSQNGYEVKSEEVYFEDKLVGRILKGHSLYSFLKEKGVDWKIILSAKLIPDDAIFVIVKNTLYIIECKFQAGQGSVDEKITTCDFKKKQYQKLLSRANIDVEYMYFLSDWFRQPRYKDSLDYIISVRCSYYFEFIPFDKLGLPMPK